MASTSPTPYTQPRAAVQATRSLLNTNPTATPATTSPTITTNYEAAATAASSSGALASTTGMTDAAYGGGMKKQQSWKLGDLKGQRQGKVVEGKIAGGTGMGYESLGGGGK